MVSTIRQIDLLIGKPKSIELASLWRTIFYLQQMNIEPTAMQCSSVYIYSFVHEH